MEHAATGVDWGILGAAFAIAIAAAFGASGQSRAIAAAVSALARNPGAAGDIRFALILGSGADRVPGHLRAGHRAARRCVLLIRRFIA